MSFNKNSIFTRLLKENVTCADCSAKGPKFVSTTFGVFVCKECAGCHKSLGGGNLSNIKPLDGNFTAIELAVRILILQFLNVKCNTKTIKDAFSTWKSKSKRRVGRITDYSEAPSQISIVLIIILNYICHEMRKQDYYCDIVNGFTNFIYKW